MTKIIRLTESDLEMIVKQVLKEQSKGKPITAPAATLTPSQPQQQSSLQPTMNIDAGKKPSTYSVSSSLLPCVPAAFKLSIQNFLSKNYDKTFLKAVLGIIGRESDFGESKRFKFTSPLKSLWAVNVLNLHHHLNLYGQLLVDKLLLGMLRLNRKLLKNMVLKWRT